MIKHSNITPNTEFKIEVLILKFVRAFPGKANKYIISGK